MLWEVSMGGIVAIVRHHGNPVYRAVAWIPICVSVNWSPKFPTCGRFPWETPTMSLVELNATLLFHFPPHQTVGIRGPVRNIRSFRIFICSSRNCPSANTFLLQMQSVDLTTFLNINSCLIINNLNWSICLIFVGMLFCYVVLFFLFVFVLPL
jgi:hypothetical protein